MRIKPLPKTAKPIFPIPQSVNQVLDSRFKNLMEDLEMQKEAVLKLETIFNKVYEICQESGYEEAGKFAVEMYETIIAEKAKNELLKT
jgi:hypothetical protein